MDTNISKTFPLREAYSFAVANGLGDQVDLIREMEIEWDRPYTTTVRRGCLIRELERRGLLSTFIAQMWPVGSTARGEAQLRFCLRIASEYDDFVGGHAPDETESEAVDERTLEFALEAHLRDFLAKNLGHIEPGLRLYEGSGRTGVEYPVEGGRIDLLAIDQSQKYVVIELKLSQGRNKALGQLLYYMGWVDQNLGNGPCRGVIVANEIGNDLVVAVSRAQGVTLSRYKMSFAIEKVKSLVV